MCARADAKACLEAGVGRPRVGQHSLRLCERTRWPVALHAGCAAHPGQRVDDRRRLGRQPAANRKQLDALTIQSHVDLLAAREAVDGSGQHRPVQVDSQGILAVERKVVPKGRASPRAEREILAHPVALELGARDRYRGHDRTHRRVTHRETTDLARGREVPLQQSGRQREDVRDIVEPEAGFVGWEQRIGVDVHRQQIAGRVGVLSPVETMDDRTAGVGGRQRRPVDRHLERGDEGVGRLRARPRHVDRGHRAAPELAHDLFPDLSVATDILQIELVEAEAGSHPPFVVAGDAVLIE